MSKLIQPEVLEVKNEFLFLKIFFSLRFRMISVKINKINVKIILNSVFWILKIEKMFKMLKIANVILE